MKRLIAGALAGLMVSAPLYPSHANLNLNGAIIEMSSPGVVRGREYTTTHGGGIRIRLQDETLRPFNIVPPSAKMGCGGIDATFGSFSFLNMEYLGQFLQNLLNPEAALVVGFQLALHVLCPTCEELLTKLNALANQINQIGVSKCGAIQLASTIGKNFIDQYLGGEVRDGRRTGNDAFMKFDEAYIQPISETLGRISQSIQTWCPGGDCLLGLYLNLQPGERKSFIKYLVQNGYIASPVLASLGGTGNAEAVLRGVFGDIVFTRKDNNSPPQPIFVPQEIPVEAFIDAWLGQFSQSGTSSPSGLSCNNNIAITGVGENLFPTTVYIGSLCDRVKPFVESLRNKVRNRQPLSTEEVMLMSSMPAPVLSLLNLASIEPGIEEAIFANMLTYISAELGATLLQSALSAQARFVGVCSSDNVGDDFKKLCMEQARRIGELSRQISSARLFYYRKFAENIDSVLKAIQLRQTVMTNLASTPIGGSLTFSQMLGGIR